MTGSLCENAVNENSEPNFWGLRKTGTPETSWERIPETFLKRFLQKLVTFQITSFTELLVPPQHILNVTSVISCLLLTEIIGKASRQSSAAEDQDQEN